MNSSSNTISIVFQGKSYKLVRPTLMHMMAADLLKARMMKKVVDSVKTATRMNGVEFTDEDIKSLTEGVNQQMSMICLMSSCSGGKLNVSDMLSADMGEVAEIVTYFSKQVANA